MDTPVWTSNVTWDRLNDCVDDLVYEFITNLPDHEYERLRADLSFYNLVREQVQQKIVSTMETYRSKGMYGEYS